MSALLLDNKKFFYPPLVLIERLTGGRTFRLWRTVKNIGFLIFNVFSCDLFCV